MARDNDFVAKPIIATTYKYKAQGKTADGKTSWGKSVGKREMATKHTSFGKLKKNVFENSKNDKNTFVNYGKRPIKSVTHTDGNTKTVTFFKRAK